MSRSYGQYCGLARALDVVGDRWNLLIVRQLLLGPARYRELAEGLGGVATNLLSNRLRELEEAGVVERRPAASGNSVVYALTPWGEELREPVNGLIRWSTPLMVSGPGDDPFLPDWLAIALPALLAGTSRAEDGATVGVVVDGQAFRLRQTSDGVDVARHDGQDLQATLRADGMIVLGLAAGAITLDDVRDTVELDGDEAVVRALFSR